MISLLDAERFCLYGMIDRVEDEFAQPAVAGVPSRATMIFTIRCLRFRAGFLHLVIDDHLMDRVAIIAFGHTVFRIVDMPGNNEKYIAMPSG